MVKYIAYGGRNEYVGMDNGSAIYRLTPLYCKEVEHVSSKAGNTIRKSIIYVNGEEKIVRDKSLFDTPLEAYISLKDRLGGDTSGIKWLLDYMQDNHAEYLI